MNLREQQQQMIEFIRTYRESERQQGLCIEAPTGTGKTLAYCIEAVNEVKAGGRVIIALHSNQLFNQCVNELKRAQEIVEYKVVVGVLKGKTHYKCPGTTKVDEETDEASDDMSDEIYHKGHKVGDCYYATRAYARTCEIVVTNHHLSQWNDIYGQGVLRNKKIVDDEKVVCDPFTLRIYDEGHALPNALHSVYEKRYDLSKIKYLHHPILIGIIGTFCDQFESGAAYEQPDSKEVDTIQEILYLLRRARAIEFTIPTRLKSLKSIIKSVEKQEQKIRDDYDTECEMMRKSRARYRSKNLARIFDRMEYTRIKDRLTIVDDLFAQQEDDYLYFRDMDGSFNKKLKTTGDYFYSGSTICVSATFSHMLTQEYLGISNVIRLTDTFDLKRQRAFHFTTRDKIVKLIEATGGDVLILCTSWNRAEEAYEQLRIAGIHSYLQGKDDNAVEKFRIKKGSVLIGVDSYWTGLDLPGDTLRHVIIDQLPFERVDTYNRLMREHYGKSRSWVISRERMIVQLRQGIGRLIRDFDDRGIISILDERRKHIEMESIKELIFSDSPIITDINDCLSYIKNS